MKKQESKMSDFVYYTEPIKKSATVNKCKLCNSQPEVKKGRTGYCTSNMSIKCIHCGITKSFSAELNNGGETDFYLSCISQWNNIMRVES